MKKLIAVFVVFALVAGTAFAETSIGGNLQMNTYLIRVDTDKDSKAEAGPLQMANAHVNVSFGDADAGGMVRLWTKMNDWTPTFFTFMWWKPADWFRLQLGQNADGDWGHAQITGWGFNGEAQQKVAIDGDNQMGPGATVSRKTKAWAPGVDNLAMNLSLYPADGLSINLSVPFNQDGSMQVPETTIQAPGMKSGWGGPASAGEIYSHMYLNVNYNIVDIGTIRVSSKLGPGYKKGDADKWYGSSGLSDSGDTTKLWLAFHLIAVDNLGAEIGLGYQLPFDNSDAKVKTNHPLGVGLGLTYSADEFNVKFRFGMNAGGSTEAAGTTIKDNTVMGVNILPSYKLDMMTIYLNAGLGFVMPEKGDTAVDWFVNPYIRKDIGGVRLYAGIHILGDNGDNTPVKFAVPIGLQCYF